MSALQRFVTTTLACVLLAALLFGTPSLVALGASTPKQLSTNYTLVNFGTGTADVTVQYLKDDGTSWPVDPANASFSIPPDFGMVQIRQYFDSTMPSGRGSVVASSSQPLGGIVQIQARGQTPTQGAYTGFVQASSMFYVPLAARRQPGASGIGNTQIIIQNADSVALDITVDLILGSATTYTKSIASLDPGVSYYYDLEEETNLPDPWIGSAVVTASGSGKIAVVSNLFTGPDAMLTFNAFASENVGPDWVAPLFFVRLNNGLSTVVTVQNLSGGEIPAGGITLNCVKDAATFPAGPATISVASPSALANNASYSFNPVTNTTMFPNAHWGGSCRVNSGSANTAVVVQMRNVGGAFLGAAAYEAVREGGTDTRLIVPLVAKRLSNGFASVVTIQNMSFAGGTTVTLRYMPSFNAAECPVVVCDRTGDGIVNGLDAIDVGPLTITTGASIQRNHRIASGAGAETTMPDSWQGSLVVTSAGAPINGFVQLTNYINTSGDTFMAHNAFTLP